MKPNNEMNNFFLLVSYRSIKVYVYAGTPFKIVSAIRYISVKAGKLPILRCFHQIVFYRIKMNVFNMAL